ETGEDGSLLVADAVPVRVFEVIEVGCRPDKDTTLVAEDGTRPLELVLEDDALIKDPVLVLVGEEPNLADLVLTPLRITSHLHDVGTPLLVEGHGDGIHHGRLVRGEGKFESRGDLEGPEGVRGFGRGDAGKLVGGD